VSSVKAFRIICKKWEKSYKRRPDAVVVEGPRAGGHLGFTYQDVVEGSTPGLEDIVREVVEAANAFDPPIPVVAAGGIFDGADIARFLKLGASGVQMATRFVCTTECDVHENFKHAYINAREGDTTIIKSPVGMPGRAIMSDFVKEIRDGKTIPFKCTYRCLRSCDPTTAPYCICRVLARAAEGHLEDSFVFAGSNVHKCTEIIPVKTLIEKLSQETLSHLNSNQE
jgi:NAD(P)H-dependent flavin oxidoreductase YrpB (nitropropane dioxygenase family)